MKILFKFEFAGTTRYAISVGQIYEIEGVKHRDVTATNKYIYPIKNEDIPRQHRGI